MTAIQGAQIGAARFVGDNPAQGIVAALKTDGTVANLLLADPSNGNTIHRALASGGSHVFHDAAGALVAWVGAAGVSVPGEVYARSSLNVREWANLLGKPTTLAGYGITDAAGAAHHHDAAYLKLSGGALSGALAVPAGITVGTLEASGPVRIGGWHEGVLSFDFNGTPTHGVKIRTNIPATSGATMATLVLEGYAYGVAAPIGMAITFYPYDDGSGLAFAGAGVTTWGGWNPAVKVAAEGGKVVVFLDARTYFVRFGVRAFAQGMNAEGTAATFRGWTAVDEALGAGATSVTALPYRNAFGEVRFTAPGGVHARLVRPAGVRHSGMQYLDDAGTIVGGVASDHTRSAMHYHAVPAGWGHEFLTQDTPRVQIGATGLEMAGGRIHLRTQDAIGGANRGISWYHPSYVTWVDYMAPGGNHAPNGQPRSSMGEVTSWARVSNVESAPGYGWLWESGGNSTEAAPAAQMALSAATGNLEVRGVVTAAGFTTTGAFSAASLATTGTLSFGTATRQMINLWQASYGIGVQGATLYARTGTNFAVYSGGVHSDTALDAGGGIPLFTHEGAEAGMRVHGAGTGGGISGLGRGQLHLHQLNGANGQVAALTFGGAQSPNDVQAGVYVQMSTDYGSRMYLRTTSNYGAGVNQSGIMLDHAGHVGVGQDSTGYRLTVAGDVYANDGWLRASGEKGVFFESFGGGWHMTDSTWIRTYNGKSLLVQGEVRAGTGLTLGDTSIQNDNLQGLWFSFLKDVNYGIYRQSGAWEAPYPDLCIAFHTGIKLGANRSYGGTRIYADSDMAAELMSVGNGDNHVRVHHSLYLNTHNEQGGGIVFSDDGDLVDLNDGYLALRFGNGVRVHAGNRTGDPAVTLGSNGHVTAGAFYTTSTREAKTAIRPLEGGALELLRGVEVVRFRYRGDPGEEEKVGFIAEETDALLSGRDRKRMDHANAIGLLLGAVQELAARNDELAERLAASEGGR